MRKVARYELTPSGSPRWTIRFDRGLDPDLTIAVRMDSANVAPLDYYVLPSIDMRVDRLRILEENGLYLDAFRFDRLDYFFSLAQLASVEAA